MNVILTGLRGTGKSSIGAKLARRLGFAFVDTDAAIEALAGYRIAELVAQHGWPYFRALEQRVVARVSGADRQVIAVGGGTLMDEENTRLLKQHGVVVLLLCDLPILQRRIAAGSNRPSLTGTGSAATELAQVWEKRRARYHAVADWTYDVSLETAEVTQDLQCKVAALYTLLQQIPGFTLTR